MGLPDYPYASARFPTVTFDTARQRMLEHIGSVEAALGSLAPDAAPVSERLRAALSPVARPALRRVG